MRHGGPNPSLKLVGTTMSIQHKTTTTKPNGNGNRTEKEKVMPLSSTKMSSIGVRYVVMEPLLNGKPIARNPFIIGKTINKNAGKPLEVRAMRGGTSYLVKCDSLEQANKLLKVSQLTDNTTVKTELHRTLNSSRCVVFCREVEDMTEDELKQELSSQGVTEVKRITKRVEGKVTPLPILILTINGTSVPEHLNFGALRVKTRAYYPSPLICFNCGRFGHMGKNCKTAKRCNKCSLEHEDMEECTNEKKCINCKEGHSAFDKRCPIYRREVEIIKIKTDRNISFVEAKREYNVRHANKPTYSEVAKRLELARSLDSPATSGHVDLKTILETSRKENEELKKINNDLFKQIAELTKKVTELTQLLEKQAQISAKPRPTTNTIRVSDPPTDMVEKIIAGVPEAQTVAPLAGALATPKRFVEPEKMTETKRKKKNKKKNGGNSSRSESEMDEGL